MDLSVNGPKVYVRITELFNKFGNIAGNLVTQTTVTLFAVTILLITLGFAVTRRSQLFIRPPQTAIFLFCLFFFLGMVLIPASCTMS